MSQFRRTFGKNFEKQILHWFPGHMGKGMKQLEQRLMQIDCVVEVHDARIPLSTRNKLFQTQILGARPHILVLNKCDLIDKNMHQAITSCLKEQQLCSDVIFTDCRTPQGCGVQDIVPLISKKVQNSHRYHRQLESAVDILVIGVPNVGKSSLINVLRNYYTKKKKGTIVGPVAGVTKSVLNKIQVCYNPPLYLFDSPGILEPQVNNVEAAFRLALCASMQDHLVGIRNIADYLLYWLNKNEKFSYVEKLGLKKPSDNIFEVLTEYAINQNLYFRFKDPATGRMVTRPNFDTAAERFVKFFRSGSLGLFFLDNDFLGTNK